MMDDQGNNPRSLLLSRSNHCYYFCFAGGIVCKICQYPIPNTEAHIFNNIRRHEKKNKQHQNIISSDNSRREIEQNFKNEMMLLVNSVFNKLPDIDEARKVLTPFLEPEQFYPYCSAPECCMLVHNKRTHKKKEHVRYCTNLGKGYSTKHWHTNSPKILPIAFTFEDKSNFCSTFWDLLQLKLQQNIPTLCTSTSEDASSSTKLQIYDKLLVEQQNDVDVHNGQLVLQPVAQEKNPNLWIERAGWDSYLKGFKAIDLYNATTASTYCNDTISESALKLMENSLIKSIYTAIHKVLTIHRTHQIFLEVERRPFQPFPKKPFNVAKRKNTWVRYIQEIQTIFRVVMRVYMYKNNDQMSNEAKTYPDIIYTSRQQSAICSIINNPENENNYIEMLLSLVDQTYIASPFECLLISSISFMSLQHDLKYKTAENSTVTFAALLAVYKVIIIYKSFTEHSDQQQMIGLCKELTATYLSCPENVKKNPSAMSWVIQTFAYASIVSVNSTREGTIFWRNTNEIVFRGTSFTMIDFRTAIHNKVEQARVLLLNLCECDAFDNLPQIPWSTIYDDMNNDSNNYSFLSEPRNNFLSRGAAFNRNRKMDDWIDTANLGFNNNRVKQFKYEVNSFLEVLLPLVHVTAGQPARGTEITVLQHTNSRTGSRNIYIDRSMVCIYTRYNKNNMLTNRQKPIFRFLPFPVGQMLVYYLWLVLPFYQTTVGNLDSKCYNSSFIFTDDIVSTTYSEHTWSTEKLSSLLCEFFGTAIGVKMNCASYRHIAIAIARKWLNLTVVTNSVSDPDNMNENNYYSDDNLEQPYHNDIWDLQAGHSTQTALRKYARLIGECHLSNQTEIDKYCYVSKVWHDFLLLNESKQQSTSFSNSAETLEETLQNERKKRLNYLSRGSSLQMLRQYLRDDGATFRGNQEEVINNIMKGTQYILQIAGTGVGKSISFMLPAFFSPTGTTIVVVPLIMLQHDLLHRCCASGITGKLWNMMDKFSTESIIFVTPESANTPSFFDYVNYLKAHHILDRLVIDECHMLFSATETFRKRMADVFEVVKVANCQVILLTATLPKQFEKKLFDMLTITDAFTICRAVTVRKNISYCVKNVHSHSFLNELQHTLTDEFTSGKCIIYVRDKKIGQFVSQQLNAGFYHSTASDKEQIYRRWFESEKKEIIIATNAIGCGVDIPNIHCVIHLGSPPTMLDFAQESGRAGRDGKPAKSILFHLKKFNFIVDSDMERYIDSQDCRRCHLDAIMDNQYGRTSCMSDEAQCDNCLSFDTGLAGIDVDEILRISSNSAQNATNIINKEQTMLHADAIFLREEHQRKKIRTETMAQTNVDVECRKMVEVFGCSQCMVCCLQKTKNCAQPYEHSQVMKRAKAQSNDLANSIAGKNSANKKTQIKSFLVCTYKGCYVPQEWCQKTVYNDIGKIVSIDKSKPCNHAWVLLNVLYLVPLLDKSFHDTRLFDPSYLMSTVNGFGTFRETINLVKLFYEMVSQYRKKHSIR